MASKRTISKCRKLLSSYKVNYSFTSNFKYPEANGFAKPNHNFICINKTITDNEFTTAVFHELQHILNYRNKKYFEYHSCNDKKTMKKWALRAEVYTDKEAKKLAKTYGFNKYQMTYKMNNYWRNWVKEFYE